MEEKQTESKPKFDPLDPDDEQEVEQVVDEDEEFYPVEYNISSYGADYPVDGLVKRINAKSIYIPKFQRGYVWNINRASRFIESLLLGLPVPAIFLSKEQESSKMLVIDGQQRLRTLQFFYNGVFEPTEKAFRLKAVHKRFEGQTYETLSEDDKLRLDDSILHAIIIKQESPQGDAESPSSVYHIFERLNTGGVLLHPQEIRTCISHGSFVDLLETLNMDKNWRNLFGKISARMRDRELILRFFALYYHHEQYAKPMKEFLTKFLQNNRNIDSPKSEEFSRIFKETTRICNEGIGEKAFKPKSSVNAALCDAVMVGICSRLRRGPILDLDELKQRFSNLPKDERFNQTIISSTTNDSNVKDRMEIAINMFEDCP